MSDSKSLVTLAEESAKLEIALSESGGELTPEIEAMLAEIDVALPEKVENYSLLIDRMTTLSAFYKDRAKFIERMASAAEKVVERCEFNLKLAMEKTGQTEIRGIDVRYKLSPTAGKVVIENEELIDPAYTVIEQVRKIEKKRIGEDLKAGVPVKGARLEVGTSLRRYANTPGKR